MDSKDTDTGKISEFFQKLRSPSSTPPEKRRTNLKVPLGKDEVCYKMDHEKRGIAVIFNHIDFDKNLKKREQFESRAPGTVEDAKKLRDTFEVLGFEVIIYDQEKLTVKIVETTLRDVSRKDFSNCDALFIVVLSHGGTNKVFAYDSYYPTEMLAQNFTPDKCPTLAGKPKILMLNLCQGGKRDFGIHAEVETDSGDVNCNVVPSERELLTYRLPLWADFLYAYSTVTGFVSYRDKDGSWFIKAFCDIFKEHGMDTEITILLTHVNNRVALNFEQTSKFDVKFKQMPCFTSTLTRQLIFFPKKVNNFE